MKKVWGPNIWLFLHCFCDKINNDFFMKNRNEVFNFIKNIMFNLPCPICSSYTRLKFKKVNFSRIKTKEDLKLLMFYYHNDVNKFNYEAIFYDITFQKKYNNLETNKLSKYQVKCPYCRNIQNGLIFWKEPYDKIYNVNWPKSKWYKSNTCKFIFKKGSKKNIQCEYKCYNDFCKKHSYSKCQAIISSGKRKGEICNAKSFKQHDSKNYCKRHFKKFSS